MINGRSILPPGWTTDAGARQMLSAGRRIDYGYMWWPASGPDINANAISAIGIFGQALYINPREGVVIAQWSAQTKPTGGEVVNNDEFFAAVALALR